MIMAKSAIFVPSSLLNFLSVKVMSSKFIGLIVAIACVGLTGCTSSDRGEEVTMSKTTLFDKIKGGWAGQVIGCAYGGPTAEAS